jgi:ArsR family metal-binding transcriptional regulator
VLAATRIAMDKARDLVEARLDGGELEKAIDEALATAGNSSTAAPASSGSTPPT